MASYILVEADNDIWTYDNGWQSVPGTSEADYESGIENIQDIPQAAWQEFQGEIKVRLGTSKINENDDSPTVRYSPIESFDFDVESVNISPTEINRSIFESDDVQVSFDIDSIPSGYPAEFNYSISINGDTIYSDNGNTDTNKGYKTIEYNISNNEFDPDVNNVTLEADGGIYEETVNLETVETNKIFFESQNNLYIYDFDTNSWEDTGLTNPTDIEYVEHGMTIEEVQDIPESAWTDFYNNYGGEEFTTKYGTTELNSTDSTSVYMFTYIPPAIYKSDIVVGINSLTLDTPVSEKYTLIKKDNKYYTFNNSWQEVTVSEDITVSDMEQGITDLSVVSESDWNRLGSGFQVITYLAEGHYEDPELSIETVNGVSYQIFYNDGWYGYDGVEWLEDYKMSKLEMEALDGATIKELFDAELHKHDLKYKAILYSNTEQAPVLQNLDTTFQANEGPLIVDPEVINGQISNDYAELHAKIYDLEGDDIEFRILIKRADDTEFYIVDETGSDADGWISTSTSDYSVNKSYNHEYFDIGTNEIKIEARDERGELSTSSWTGTITLTNEDPYIIYSNTPFSVTGSIGDPDDQDQVRWRLFINDEIQTDWSEWLDTSYKDDDDIEHHTATFIYQWESDDVIFGEENKFVIEVEDSKGAVIEEEFWVIGTYRNILFRDKQTGDFYSDDTGEPLMYLEVPNMIAGQNSEAQLIELLNQSGNPLEDVTITPDDFQLPSVAEVRLSEGSNPFVSVPQITVSSVMDVGDTKDFYVRIESEPGKGGINKEFKVHATGDTIPLDLWMEN